MVTLGDVAKAAGTSTTTVSRVLNGCGTTYRISARTQAEVLAAAERLGYRPSYHARALKAGRSQTIGLLSPAGILGGRGKGYFTHVIDGINSVVRRAGYNLLLTSDDDRDRTLQQGIEFWKEQRVDALITFGFLIRRYLNSEDAPQDIQVENLPLVLIESDSRLDYPVVEMHCQQGIQDAVAHLADLGHRRIAYLCGNELPKDRVAAFQTASASHQLEHRVVPLASYRHPAEQEHWQRIAGLATVIDAQWDQLADCSAIMCWNDEMALSLQQVMYRRQVRVPDDYSIIGFDDIYAQTALPALSTISHNLVEMGRRAGEIALGMAAAPETVQDWHQQRIPVEATYLPRASTAAPNSAAG